MTGYLCHHGIKGMRWGVRRFQRKDGSYTEAGKKRYSNDANTDETEKKWHLTDRQKKALIAVGASAVAVGLAAYGLHRYRDVLNDRTAKALAAEGRAIENESWRISFGRQRFDSVGATSKKEVLNARVRAYEGSKDPFKVIADITTKQDYLKEHRLARDRNRGRLSIYDNSRPFGSDHEFRMYVVGENPGHDPSNAPFEFDPTITLRDVVRGVRKRQ